MISIPHSLSFPLKIKDGDAVNKFYIWRERNGGLINDRKLRQWQGKS